MFATLEKAKAYTENTRGVNLAAVKPMTVQVTKLPLKHKTCKIDMIWFAKPGMTEDLPEGKIVNNILYGRYVHLTKGQAYS
jgi:hypothetical protein